MLKGCGHESALLDAATLTLFPHRCEQLGREFPEMKLRGVRFFFAFHVVIVAYHFGVSQEFFLPSMIYSFDQRENDAAYKLKSFT
jgi:hypothetical protein